MTVTVSISDNLSGIANRSTTQIVYTLTFSAPVTGLDASDLGISNATLSTISGSGTTWNVALAPRMGVASGSIGLTLNAGAVQDGAGDTNAAITDSSQVIDTFAPLAPKPVTGATFNYLVNPRVTLQTSAGTIEVELFPEQAPATVANMLAYTSVGFYDTTIFHRVIQGFMVQGGGFVSGMASWGTIWSPIALESSNGLSNLRGTIAMARTSAPNSATTQFYINQVDNPFLDYASSTSPGYAVFGQVVAGMAVVDAIAGVATHTVGSYADVPVSDVTIQTLRQTTAGSAITNAAVFTLEGMEAGGQWIYSLNGGTNWYYGSGSSLNVPVGSYAAGAIRVAQIDAAGNYSSFYQPYNSALTVEVTPPTVTGFSPNDGATGVAWNSNLVLSFSEIVQRGSGTLVLKDGAGQVIESFDVTSSTRLSLDGSVLTIDPTQDLAPGTSFHLEVAAGAIRDLAGNAYAGGSGYDFTTVAGNRHPTGAVSISGTAQAGQTLQASHTLADANGLGQVSYQWHADGQAIAGATGDTLVLPAELVGKTLTVTASYTDAQGYAESVTGGFPKDVHLLAYVWNTHALLDGVSLRAESQLAVTDGAGLATVSGISNVLLDVQATRTVTAAQTAATDAAVGLQDAIAILKMVVGLPVNPAGRPLSPYQALAADFDGNGSVGLADAIGVLKHVVGLSAPQPTWHFADEADASMPARATMSPGLAPAIAAQVGGGPGSAHVGLVAYLSGDVDGSYVAPGGSLTVEQSQPDYFSALLQSHPELNPTQFGIY